MPLNALKKAEPLLGQLLKNIPPRTLIAHVAKADKPAYFRHFKGYRMDRFGRPTVERIVRKEVYERESELWAQLLIILWNQTNKDVYGDMRKHVQELNEDVEKVEKIEDDVAMKWIDEMVETHLLEDLLLCTYLNEVRFSDAFIRSRMETPLGIQRPETPAPTEAPAEAPAAS